MSVPPLSIVVIAWLGFSACASDDHTDRTPPDSGGDADTDADSDADGDADTDTDLGWTVPARVALPFAVVGDAAPSADLDVSGGASQGPIDVAIDGPFTVDGDLSALTGGQRALSVSFDGSMADPSLATGTATIAIDGESQTVELAAVVGASGLGAAVWDDTPYGHKALVDLPSAPNADGSTPWHDDTVLISVPPGLTDRDGVDVVTHLHGHNSIIEQTAAAEHLVEYHALSGRDAVFVAPQGPVNTPSGDFGQLADPGGHARLIRDVIAVLYRDGFVAWPVIGEQVLTSHSGGYVATAAIVTGGGLPIRTVNLYDSLYGYASTFEAFAIAGGTLRSNYTSGGGTDGNNLGMATYLRSHGVTVGDAFTDDALSTEPVIVGFSVSIHTTCMSDERTYARWLTWSGLPFRPGATPELRSVVRGANTVSIGWVPDGQVGASVRVEGSDDGTTWRTLAESATDHAEVAATARVRIRLVDGDVVSGPSDVYGSAGGDGPRWLVVDGFDRVIGGSYTLPDRPFAANVGLGLDRPFDVASNEAVADGSVDLGGYDAVLWLLGDESTADVTFDADEQAEISGYVAGGGRIVVSGSEVGFATPGAWLRSALGATYVSDDAGTLALTNGDTFGVAYPEDYPDVLAGDQTLWTYSTGGAAAVVSGGKRVVVGFPLETLDPAVLSGALSDLEDAIGE